MRIKDMQCSGWIFSKDGRLVVCSALMVGRIEFELNLNPFVATVDDDEMLMIIIIMFTSNQFTSRKILFRRNLNSLAEL